MPDLGFLVGEFAGPEAVAPSPWTAGGSADGTVSGRFELGGAVVVQNQSQSTAEVTTFEAVNVFQLDPATGETLLYSFDSVGYPPDPPARGSWHGESLVLDRTTARGSSRTTYIPTADGYEWSKVFRAPDGPDWSPVISGRLTRR